MSDLEDPREELRQLVSGFRAHLGWRERGGAYAAPAGRTPRQHPEPDATADATADAAAVSATDGSRSAAAALAAVRDAGDCRRCKLCDGRKNIVFGVGDPNSPLMFVGEGPGAQEDSRGEPFVGPAGQLLDRMIAAMGWTRETVYIANVVKCRPPDNRNPEADEVEACEPFLARQIEAIRPRIIVTLGRPAAQLLLRTNAPISSMRGRFQDHRGIAVMPTFHPAFLLRTPGRKRDVWEDLQKVIAELERLGIEPPNPPRA